MTEAEKAIQNIIDRFEHGTVTRKKVIFQLEQLKAEMPEYFKIQLAKKMPTYANLDKASFVWSKGLNHITYRRHGFISGAKWMKAVLK